MRNLDATYKHVFELVESVDSQRGDTVNATKLAKLRELHSKLGKEDQAGSFELWCARLRATLDSAGQTGRSRLMQAAVAAADLNLLACKLAAVVEPSQVTMCVNGQASAPRWLGDALSKW